MGESLNCSLASYLTFDKVNNKGENGDMAKKPSLKPFLWPKTEDAPRRQDRSQHSSSEGHMEKAENAAIDQRPRKSNVNGT